MTTTAEVTRSDLSFKIGEPVLALLADILDDAERTRIANENRLRQLTRVEVDEDGQIRGHGITEDNTQSWPLVVRVQAMVETLQKVEADAAKNLALALKANPLHPWIIAQKGIGDKQASRLLATIGDPTWNTLHNRPRELAELWAFCGLHTSPDTGTAVRRSKGQQSNWNTNAKMRAYLIAESASKQLKATCKTDDGVQHIEDCECSPWRIVYDVRKAKTGGRLHKAKCVRCGPAGKPADVGSPWSDGHRHADALRIVSKQILKGLWRESRKLQGLPLND